MLITMLGYFAIKGTYDIINANVHSENIDRGIYRDANGQLRSRGKKVIMGWENGDTVYLDPKTDKIYYNKTLAQAKENEQKALKNGEKFFLRQSGNTSLKLGDSTIAGERYCMVGSSYDKCYVKRKIIYDEKDFHYSGEYYMDMNYKIICPTKETEIADKQKYENKSKNIQDNIIRMVNNKIKEKILTPWYSTPIIIGDSEKYRYKNSCQKINNWK